MGTIGILNQVSINQYLIDILVNSQLGVTNAWVGRQSASYQPAVDQVLSVNWVLNRMWIELSIKGNQSRVSFDPWPWIPLMLMIPDHKLWLDNLCNLSYGNSIDSTESLVGHINKP